MAHTTDAIEPGADWKTRYRWAREDGRPVCDRAPYPTTTRELRKLLWMAEDERNDSTAAGLRTEIGLRTARALPLPAATLARLEAEQDAHLADDSARAPWPGAGVMQP